MPESFWANLFQANKSALFRAGYFIIFLTFLFLALVIGALWSGLKLFDNYLSDKVDVVFDVDNGKISFSRGNLFYSSIDVHGGEFGVPSGVRLDKNKTITVSASGAVSTEPGLKNSIHEINISKVLDYLSTGWRGPNGKQIYITKEYEAKKIKSDGNDEIYKRFKAINLIPNEEFGYLLGFVSWKVDDKNKDAVIKSLIRNDGVEKFRIGMKAIINYDNKMNKFAVTSFNEDNSVYTISYLEDKYNDHELYLVVNDCIIKNEESLRNVICADSEFSEPEQKIAAKNAFDACKNCEKENFIIECEKIENYKGSCKRIYDFISYQLEIYKQKNPPILVYPQAMWYMDNIGHFSVVLKVEKSGG